MSHIFISYSHVDTLSADEICALLDEGKVPYFRDVKDINWGDPITHRVHSALDEALAVLVIVSPASLKSHWVPYEVGYCVAMKRRILPFLTHPSLEVPAYISDLKWVTSLEGVARFFSSAYPDLANSARKLPRVDGDAAREFVDALLSVKSAAYPKAWNSKAAQRFQAAVLNSNRIIMQYRVDFERLEAMPAYEAALNRLVESVNVSNDSKTKVKKVEDDTNAYLNQVDAVIRELKRNV